MTPKVLCETHPDGGFVAVDLATGISAYAYPSSTHAVAARKRPVEIAKKMLAKEIALRSSFHPSLIPLALANDRTREALLRARNGLRPANRA